eukprot:CAMPEP_0118932944 /NCGR_PEP_ID=MMETSP1169-20130426/10763_1 /TAXON_ID=36882 /ORGANISM="Pyramimonas obovata, Strain CCMP722" /LENGTH=120 /DNA_ID=CAMNT_0006875653 /DNA_START=47 /DNA_END=409 /DNA_ORIENTATION=+
MASKLFKADSGIPYKYYHTSHICLAGMAPASLYLSPSKLSMPVDLALAVTIPLHMQVGMNHVVTDYAPKLCNFVWKKHPVCTAAQRSVVMGMTGATILGLTKLALEGKGLVGTAKEFWRP